MSGNVNNININMGSLGQGLGNVIGIGADMSNNMDNSSMANTGTGVSEMKGREIEYNL